MVQDIRTMGLPALLSFHTVVRLGGISAAAKRLGLAKSGVSRHVAQLEEHFGAKLFERGARTLRPTPVGLRLDQRIQSILAEIDLLDDIVRDETVNLSGQVTIAATPEFGGFVAKHLFPVVHTRHPGLTLAMRPSYIFEDMQDPGTDIAFRVGTFDDERLVARPMGAFRRWLVASPSLANHANLDKPQDLSAHPCLVFRGDTTEAQWRLTQGDDTVTVAISGPFGVQSFTILLELAIAGHGFAFLPDFMLGPALDAGHLVRCLPTHVSHPVAVYLTYRPGARRIARVNAVLSQAEAVVPRLLSAGHDVP